MSSGRAFASLLLLLLLAVLPRLGGAAYEGYPEGWCDRRFGTPTSTTGECMCRWRCEGRGCQSAQGFIWFKYADCTACQCVAADPTAADDRAPDDDGDDDEIPYGSLDSEEAVMGDDVDDDRSLAEVAFDVLDEHGAAIIAVFFVLVMICIFVPILLLSAVKPGVEASAPATKPATHEETSAPAANKAAKSRKAK